MSSFIGTDTYAIDQKGRISIPPRMRRAGRGEKPLATLILNRGFDGCVAAYTPEKWKRVMDNVRRSTPQGDPRARMMRRAFLTDAREVTVDAQGRVPIPPALIRHAGLGKEAVLHGADDYIEIWSPERFAQTTAPVLERDGEYEKLAAEFLKDSTE